MTRYDSDDYFQEILNFTYTLRKPPDGNWGSIKSDGSWSGMVNELIQKRADMGKFYSKTQSAIYFENLFFD